MTSVGAASRCCSSSTLCRVAATAALPPAASHLPAARLPRQDFFLYLHSSSQPPLSFGNTRTEKESKILGLELPLTAELFSPSIPLSYY